MTSEPRPAVFVSHTVGLQPGGGGVQRCTREYLTTIGAAGFTPRIESFDLDRRFSVRLMRRLFHRPHRDFLPPELADRCLGALDAAETSLVFLNHSETGPLAAVLRARSPRPLTIVMLSHGLDSTDFLHERDISSESQRHPHRSALGLGTLLFTEMKERPEFDAVFCLSEIDLHIERWIGTRRACLLPRVVENHTLAWRPTTGRIGTVSTLSHPPNWEGLKQFCQTLQRRNAHEVRLRVIGGPESFGRRLSAAFSQVDYLGAISDSELETEAATWCAFVNPIFRYARGCSTKLAQPLSWRVPVATTRAGARGYHWDENFVPLADDPDQLAAHAIALALAPGDSTRSAIARIAAASPGQSEVAALMHATLAPLL